MANYYGLSRSNYFRVKVAAAFLQWAESLGLNVINKVDSSSGVARYGLVADTNEGWPLVKVIKNPESEHPEEVTVHVLNELSRHLADDGVAVLMEIGNQKLQFLNGTAYAVHSDGRTVRVHLNEIYERAAKELGVEVSAINPCAA